MNTAHATDRPSHEYQPTIIECRPLISRLAVQLAFVRDELKQSWPEFKKNPVACTRTKTRELLKVLRASPNAIPITLAAVVAITCGIVMLITVDKNPPGTDRAMIEVTPEIVYLNHTDSNGYSIGLDGPGRVGFQKDTGEGSGPSQKLAHGGGGGGNHNPLQEQQGKLPPPSNIQAAIPTAPPIHVQALPEAGMDLDPALWTDLKAPVFGDPKSNSTVESKGPGEGEGIGSNNGLGVGAGRGPGYGPGDGGNIGEGTRDTGCCGVGGGRDGGLGGGLRGFYRANEVDQKARLLSKPEPQYTEEARKNQLSGTVILRAVFTSSGEVVQIRAVHALPFGLTENAIAAARKIQFVPAVKGGQRVSVSMQLEYNFNLY